MSEPSDSEPGGESPPATEAVGDALKAAVERTLAVTADSATGTRQRAQGLLDDVVRRGQVAREQVTRRGEEASSRLAEAINELRTADRDTIEELAERLAGVESRLAGLERALQSQANPSVEVDSIPAEPHVQRESEG